MTCDLYAQQFDDYVDGTLDPRESAAVAAHLESCPSCRALVKDLTTLRAATRQLEPALPSPHVWQNISAALDAERRTLRGRLRMHVWSWRPSPALAAAAVVVLLVGGAWTAWHEVVNVRASRPPANAASAKAVETFENELNLAEEHYTKAIASLEQITKADGSALDTQTAQVLQQNLAVIDTAIGQSREALTKEPTSEVAQESLFDALRSKVSLLQDTVALINEMRKGNQAGAARIVSGMSQ
jgi:predicted anti-sigma-YlaC factor YlaD